jgi:lantibiotic biosynthesis protein
VESAVRAQPAHAVSARAPLFTEDEAARALAIAERVRSAAAAALANEPGPPESIGRRGGTALVTEALARAGRAGVADVRAALESALVFAPDRLSLYGGAAGLLVAIEAIDPEQTSLRGPREKLRAALAAALRDAPPGRLDTVATYDLISGPSGFAIALARSAREPVDAFAPFARAFAETVDNALAAAPESVNLGVSHGIAGVLAALNLALPGDRALARRYAELLLRCSHEVRGARRWDAVWRPDRRPSARLAWCYQTAGVAAVLADRARLDGDAPLGALAAGAFAAVLDDDDADPALWDFALCHGRGGVASLAWRFAGEARLLRHAERLAREILAAFDERAPFGYRAAVPSAERYEDRAEFLDGALGVAQFLIDAATAQERRWLPLFGLLPD